MSTAGVSARRSVQAAPTDAETTAAVVAAVRAGDVGTAREQFGALVELHQRRAWRIALMYLRNTEDADDAVQDAFVKAFTHMHAFDPALPFGAWFTRILVNGCLDRLKAGSRRRRWQIPAAEAERDLEACLPSSAPAADEVVSAAQQRKLVVSALQRLPQRQREVVALTHFGDCSTREVSDITGLNESTVRVHLFRAVRRLRQLLAPQPARAREGMA